MSVGVVNKQTGDRIPTAGMPAIDNALDLMSVNPVQNAVITAALAGKADTGIVADDFDSTASYVIGNYCIENGKLYRFKANHSGAWAAADVDEIQIAGELSSIKSGLTNKEPFGGTTTGNKTFAVGGNLEFRTDAEGGNITITSPNNVQFEIDGYTDTLRIWSRKSGALAMVTWDGVTSVNLESINNKLNIERNNVIARSYAEAFTDYIFGNETDFYGYMPIIRKKQADGTYISFGIYEDKFVKVTYDAQGQFVSSQVATFS